MKAGDLLVDAQIPDLSIGVSFGSSVTIACHMVCWTVMKLGIMESDGLPPDVKVNLAHRLLRCLCDLAFLPESVRFHVRCAGDQPANGIHGGPDHGSTQHVQSAATYLQHAPHVSWLCCVS